MDLERGAHKTVNYCPYCGTKVNLEWDYCPNCSTYLVDDKSNIIRRPSYEIDEGKEARSIPQAHSDVKNYSYSSRNQKKKDRRANIIIAILSLSLISSVIGNIILSSQIPIGPGPSVPGTILTVGTNLEPASLDPLNAWDSGSYDVIQQVAETLFWYDLSDPALPLEPFLVENYAWSGNDTVLSLTLKNSIIFHDAFSFNASAVKWNIDRWLYLTNSTGLLEYSSQLAYPSSMFFFIDGTPIISHCDVVDEFIVNITLNRPFGPFVSLLSAPFCSMISPYSHSQTQYINLLDGVLIGTGPFSFNYYLPNVRISFSRWTGYWRMPSFYERLFLEFFSDQQSSSQALFEGTIDIDLNFPPIVIIEEFYRIKLVRSGTDLTYWYMGFNNQKINRTLREALSFAFNYTRAIESIKSGNAERGCPAVPQGMAGHNSSVQSNLPQINITHARLLMQEMGYGVGWDVDYPGLDESSWNNACFATDLFGTPLKLNLNLGSSINALLNELATECWRLIGIDITVEIMDRYDFLSYCLNEPEHFDVWYVGWAPDYPEPYNMLEPLFALGSTFNIGQVNISLVNELLYNASLETDLNSRLNLYQRIQYILFEKEFVHMPLWANYQYTAHASYLKGVPYNSLDRFYAYPIYEFQ